MKTRCPFAVFATLLFALNLQAQQSLSDLVLEANADWMFGSWKATTNEGGSFTLNLSWDLRKHVVVLHGKGDDVEFKGYTAIEPGGEQPVYVGFDDRGAVTKGKWGMENNELVLRVETRDLDGTWKMAAVFTSASGGGMNLRIHRIDEWGNLVTPEQTTLRFKKS